MSTLEVDHGASSFAIAEVLRSEILAGTHAPGARLAEVALAKRFVVSRSPVREALRSLADLGIVTFVPNVGVRVRLFTKQEAASLYELRVALESEAARLAARRCGSHGREELLGLLKAHNEVVTRHPTGAYLQGGQDKDFHVTVARLSQNTSIVDLLANQLDPQLTLLRRQHRNVEGRGLVALSEHHRVAEAIASNDEELAALLMRRHIQNSWAALQGQLSREDVE